MMQPMMPPATGPTGALLIMFSVITSSPAEKQRTDVLCQHLTSGGGGGHGARVVGGKGAEWKGLVDSGAML